MATKKKKYYVVWRGHRPGIYDDWTAVLQQITSYQGALYKSYKSRWEAEKAYEQGPSAMKAKKETAGAPFIRDSISVDAACSGNPGVMEYRGVDTASREELFHQGPFPMGTNNLGEFLALVHALALQKKAGTKRPVYTDSGTALAWVRNKKVKTMLPRNEKTRELWDMVDRAETWLRKNSYDIPVYKWDTRKWGEIPADFGRK